MLSAPHVRRCCLGALCLLASQWLVLAAASETLTLDVRDARASHDQRTRQPVLHITLTGPAGNAFARLTRDNVGRAMELRIDGKTVLTAVIREPILGGTVQISGPEADEAHSIAERLLSGVGKVQVTVAPN
jgi:preprotein translocase subunit SecD